MEQSHRIPDQLKELIKRGVEVDNPATLSMDSSIDIERIAPTARILGPCRLSGQKTSIGSGTIIGSEGQVTIDNCRLGRNVQLKGGFFSNATFLDGASMGLSAHVRTGTLLEEQANAAHNVGLKQTILMPFVTAGSLINFCDCMMAGGTSRKNHSEIGSSYVHFNYTPNQDKATPSLIGDVPRGVMLDQSPIFLGGQGGLVGPSRIEYGTIIAAGSICRKDILETGKLVAPSQPTPVSRNHRIGCYQNITRIMQNNLLYLGNLRALQAWYLQVRSRFMQTDAFDRACFEGAMNCLKEAVTERIRQLGKLADKMQRPLELAQSESKSELPAAFESQKKLLARWPELSERMNAAPSQDIEAKQRDALLASIESSTTTPYLEAVANLTPKAKASGTTWLQSIVDEVAGYWA